MVGHLFAVRYLLVEYDIDFCIKIKYRLSGRISLGESRMSGLCHPLGNHLDWGGGSGTENSH